MQKNSVYRKNKTSIKLRVEEDEEEEKKKKLNY